MWIYINLYYLSSNTTHAFFLPPGFHGKSVGENRGRFTYSHITHGLVWFFFLHLRAGFLYTCLSRMFDIVINNRDAIRLHRISHFPDIRLEARVCPQFFFFRLMIRHILHVASFGICGMVHTYCAWGTREFWMVDN